MSWHETAQPAVRARRTRVSLEGDRRTDAELHRVIVVAVEVKLGIGVHPGIGDFGIDLELFDGRVGIISDYYIKKTSDMLYAAPIPLVVPAAPAVPSESSGPA